MAPVAQGAEAGGASAAPATDVARDVQKESGPFGGCEPIGLTASGELVFPLDCKKLIKKPAEAPVAAVDKTADDRTASTDAKADPKSAQSSPSATAEAKPAANDAAAAAQPVPAAEEKQATAGDKAEAVSKAAALDPAAAAKPASSNPATGKATPAKPAAAKTISGRALSVTAAAGGAAPSRTASGNAPGKPSTDKPSTDKPSTDKPSAGKATSAKAVVVAVKDAAPKGGQTEQPKPAGKETGKPTTMSAIRSMIVMAKPANTGTPVAARSQAEERPRRTAGLPPCVQFRSYNPATRSYRGFDGHTYACR
ncbi:MULTISPECIES: hypothetical protein [unclassified Bradyrhizobium]|uniref:hypothetical protein n=1 Tax=unclassified Bradyrhizobium TaxID=2631580 RepID=UPI0028EEDB9D|nr:MULTISPECIES: hypothetical protein [unclassified Bradyrhizobium]